MIYDDTWYIWVNYDDLNQRPQYRWRWGRWMIMSYPKMAELFRLVNYYKFLSYPDVSSVIARPTFVELYWNISAVPSTLLWIIYLSGWWFGTFLIFPYIGNNHPNWLSYFSEGFKPPTSYILGMLRTDSCNSLGFHHGHNTCTLLTWCSMENHRDVQLCLTATEGICTWFIFIIRWSMVKEWFFVYDEHSPQNDNHKDSFA